MNTPSRDLTTALHITKTLAAPRELVFRAWTEPEILKRWWRANEDCTMPIAEVDLRVGHRQILSIDDEGIDPSLAVALEGSQSGGDDHQREHRDAGPGVELI